MSFWNDDCDCDWCGKCNHCHKHKECLKKLNNDQDFREQLGLINWLNDLPRPERAEILEMVFKDIEVRKQLEVQRKAMESVRAQVRKDIQAARAKYKDVAINAKRKDEV